MSAKNLFDTICHVNFIATFSKERPIDPRNITVGDAIRIFRSIDCQLSPENLCCDGELSPAKVRQKRARLLGAAAELKKRGFRAPADVNIR